MKFKAFSLWDWNLFKNSKNSEKSSSKILTSFINNFSWNFYEIFINCLEFSKQNLGISETIYKIRQKFYICFELSRKI